MKASETSKKNGLQHLGRVGVVMLAAASGSFGMGCMTEADEQSDVDTGDVTVGETEQAFSSNWIYQWRDSKYNATDIGTTVGRACYMSGVAGHLTQDPWGLDQSNYTFTSRGAGVYQDGYSDRYVMYVKPAESIVPPELQTWVRCVNTSSRTPAEGWSTGDPKTILAPVAPGRRCFIRGISTTQVYASSVAAFDSPNDYVYVSNDGSNWYVHGNLSGLASVSASCINVTEDLGTFQIWADEGTSTTGPLVPATNGATCFLTKVSGKLDSYDWWDGTYVSHNTVNNYLYLNAKNGNGGEVRCVR